MQSAPEFADPSVADNETMAFARDRVFALAKVIQSLLDQTPASLASTQGLNQLHANLQAPLNELTAFLSNKNPGHISNAAAQIDQSVQPLLWGFAPQTQGISKPVLPEILDAQASSARESVHQLVAQRDDLASRFQALSVKADEYATRLEALSQRVLQGSARKLPQPSQSWNRHLPRVKLSVQQSSKQLSKGFARTSRHLNLNRKQTAKR